MKMKMIAVKSYRDLGLCLKSMDLVVKCYQLTSQFSNNCSQKMNDRSQAKK